MRVTSITSVVWRMMTMLKRSSPPSHPYGWWRCTHAKEGLFADHYTVGELYECRSDQGGSPRIYHNKGGCWAPYWVPSEGRFCYSLSELRFEYVGPTKPKEIPTTDDFKKQIQFHLDAIQSLLKGIK